MSVPLQLIIISIVTPRYGDTHKKPSNSCWPWLAMGVRRDETIPRYQGNGVTHKSPSIHCWAWLSMGSQALQKLVISFTTFADSVTPTKNPLSIAARGFRWVSGVTNLRNETIPALLPSCASFVTQDSGCARGAERSSEAPRTVRLLSIGGCHE